MIETELQRFRKIVQGKIREDMKKYISSGELIGRKGKDFISIPVPQIDLPSFRFGRKGASGVGQGKGEIGDPISFGDDDNDGSGKAGNAPGHHILEVDLTLEEFGKILGEELELPRIQPKGKEEIDVSKHRFTSERRVGPESLRRFKSMYKRALKRSIASGLYDPLNPIISYIPEDKRYLSWKDKKKPQSDALIIYMMDVSGSMGDEQKEIARQEAFWINVWIESNYKNTKKMYIVHDSVAQVVDSETFFHIRESGGTIISSAYKLSINELEQGFPEENWNVYIFQFSDGDNWSSGDTEVCIKLLKEKILKRVNLFGYCQTVSEYGSGQFINELKNNLNEFENLVTSEVESKDDILQSIQDFLGKGK